MIWLIFIGSLISLVVFFGCASVVTVVQIEPRKSNDEPRKIISYQNHRVIDYPNTFFISLSGVETEIFFSEFFPDSSIRWQIVIRNKNDFSCLVKLFNNESCLLYQKLKPKSFYQRALLLSGQEVSRLRLEIKLENQNYSIYYPSPYNFFRLQPIFSSSVKVQ